MAKRVLGRGLDELMNGQTVPVLKGPLAPRPKDPADLGPGLRVLILQRSGAGLPESTPAIKEPWAGLLAVKLSLIGADLMILVLVWLWLARGPGTLNVLQITGGIAATGFGAWLASLAVWLHLQVPAGPCSNTP